MDVLLCGASFLTAPHTMDTNTRSPTRTRTIHTREIHTHIHTYTCVHLQENCFDKPLEDMCSEERVFFKLMSGLHTSITAHIFWRYVKCKYNRRQMRWHIHRHGSHIQSTESYRATHTRMHTHVTPTQWYTYIYQYTHNAVHASVLHRYEQDAAGAWSSAPWIWKKIMGAFPERTENLYFTLLFELRALSKLKPYLSSTSDKLDTQVWIWVWLWVWVGVFGMHELKFICVCESLIELCRYVSIWARCCWNCCLYVW